MVGGGKERSGREGRIAEEGQKTPESKKLSFAWIPYEILAEVKKRRAIVNPNISTTRSPIVDVRI